MFRKIIKFVLVIMIIFSSYKILHKLYRYKVAYSTYNEIKNIKYTAKEKKEDFNLKLKRENPDYMFWIKVKGTKIDYPVVQGEDNKFYLNHDFYKKNSISGTLFSDYRNKDDNNSNLIIYGHNMRDGSMFHDLIKFKDMSFIKDNNRITIESLQGIKKYKVFSVYVESGYNDFIKINFQSKNDKSEYLNSIKKKSMYVIDEAIREDDSIITLITCSYEFNEARTIVHGKMIY